jgi:acetylornithine deacetylase/succinyl-diaminopimelate desuccinylase-like protein
MLTLEFAVRLLFRLGFFKSRELAFRQSGTILRDLIAIALFCIAGRWSGTVRVTGREDHAGTTPMDSRLDALAGASRIIAYALQTAEKYGRPTVCTVGRVEASRVRQTSFQAPQLSPSTLATLMQPGSTALPIQSRHMPRLPRATVVQMGLTIRRRLVPRSPSSGSGKSRAGKNVVRQVTAKNR